MRPFTQHLIRLSIAVLLAAVVLVSARTPATAQTEATQLSALAVELWPDYDRPAMLVLLTGELSADTSLPATVTIPIPAGADVNAVARFDENGGLLSDVEYTIADGRLTLTTPTNRFRVEYYAPYDVDGNEYAYTFDWTAPLIIDQLTTVVQQPIAANNFRVTPAPTGSAADRGDGLNYHTLPERSLGAGEPYTVEVAYTVDAPLLSAPAQTLPGASTPAATADTGQANSATGSFNPLWLLAAAGALALLGGAWYLGRRQGRTASRAHKPQPTRPAVKQPKSNSTTAPSPKTGSARYCHNCGRPAQPGDTFCRHCGTQLKAD